jgi:holo-[acyl-carrier protein] synthase
MIIGVGTDMVDARRVASSIECFGDKFLTRVFTDAEIAHAQSKRVPHLSFAKRFAAKEAVAKALGTGISGFRFRDIEVVTDARGKPGVRLHGGADERLNALLPDGYEGTVHLSLTDETPYALAFAVIEAYKVTKI